MGGRPVCSGPRRARRESRHRARHPRGRAGHARDPAGRRRRDRGPSRDLRRGRMKCNRCRGAAIVEVRRHNAAYCKDCFIHVFREQVKRAIRQHDMVSAGDRILVAVSGRQGFARPLGRAARAGVRRRRPVPRAGDRRLLEPVRRGDEDVRRRAGRRARSSSTWSGTTATTSRPPGRRAPARRAPSADCPSGTSSTAPPWRAGSTWSPPVTTWTTRRRRSWATRCAGRPSTSRGSRRRSPGRTAW